MKNVRPKFRREPSEEEKGIISQLKAEIESYDNEIVQLREQLDGLEKGSKDHIKLLHQYNELKDLGQELLGNLATIRNTTSRKLYPDFGLDEED